MSPGKTAKSEAKPRKAGSQAAKKVPARKAIDGPEAVDAHMRAMKHRLDSEIGVLRAIIMAASPKLQERVKWNAPSYCYKGADMAAFNLHAKDFVLIVFVFPRGLIEDRSGLLEGDWKDRRMAKFHDMKDIAAKKGALTKVVNAWVRLMDRAA